MKALERSELPVCPVGIRAAILGRQAAGQPLVPERIARKIRLGAAMVRQRRNPTNAGLDYLNAAGSLFFFTHPLTGERRPPLPGEVIECDDATINFPVCVPWTLGGDPCSEKFGVKLGRFQWLLAIDAASRYIPAWTYVMRPRSSYRAEDALSLMYAHAVQHGIPVQWRFEQGVWRSKLVQGAVKAMGSDLRTVYSPHQKPHIEGLFNTLWTKLSVEFPEADVGRFRGENEAANEMFIACHRGHRDPRKCFPSLKTAVAAFQEVIAEKQMTPVESEVGRWVPMERWAARPELRRLAPEAAWMFAPVAREWTVRGMLVGGRIPLFEDLSVPFDFSAPWLAQYHGARLRVHFDPRAPHCQATLILLTAPPAGSQARTGDVLGTARQINEIASYARLVLGWADDALNAGRVARQQAAAALRREVRAIIPGRAGYSSSTEHDGISMTTAIKSGPGAGAKVPGLAAAGSQSSGDLKAREAEVAERLKSSPLDFI